MIQLLITLVGYATNIFSILILARVILSWVSHDPANQLVAIVHRLTEPVLGPVRNFLPSMGGMDFTPMVVLLTIQIMERFLVRFLIGMA